MLEALVQGHQEIQRGGGRAVDAGHEGRQPRRQLAAHQIGGEVVPEAGVVVERKRLGRWLQEEIERVVDRHFRHEVHRDLEAGGLLRDDQAGEVVGERVLLPVHEVLRGLDAQGIGQDRGPAMRRGAQPHDLR
ncbi:hypothetical protein D3C72_771070 [compost metagenome]